MSQKTVTELARDARRAQMHALQVYANPQTYSAEELRKAEQEAEEAAEALEEATEAS